MCPSKTVYLLGALLARQALATPIPYPQVSLAARVARRSEAGPEIRGVNFPDPSIIQFNDTWYAFATRTIGSSIHIQFAESNKFGSWSMTYNEDGSQWDALPYLPPWVNSNSPNTWAPDVNQLGDGTFVMYFAATTAQDYSRHCVGAAFSNEVAGPYSPQKDPLFCPLAQGGAIDASGYDDLGQRYVVYKVDGNSRGHGGPCGNTYPPIVSTPIILQAVGPDGVTFVGGSVTILDNDGLSDQGVVEAPSLVAVGGTYILFFSSGCFRTSNYTVNYATSNDIKGPYERATRPLFETGDYGLLAPGGMDIYLDGNHMLFHADYGHGRALYEAFITVGTSKVTA